MTRNISNLSLPKDGLPAGQPEPVAARIGDFVITSAVPGVNAKTGEVPSDPESQFAHAFENVNTLLEKAGADARSVGLVTVFTPGREGRAFINKPWLAMFPDEADRPASGSVRLNGLDAHGLAEERPNKRLSWMDRGCVSHHDS